ncbi:MAG: flippase-like domain-containing protein [Halanaeroarchaeum sp.]
MSDRPVEVSVVLPAYNEEDTIEETVEVALAELDGFLPADAYEVIVAEDGCEDRTPEIADRMAAADDRVRHFHSDERLGRGGALDRAFQAADGDTLVYFDTDLATDIGHLEELVESVRSDEWDLATGSRWMPGQEADRPAKRGIPSRGFNFLVRALLGSELRDHQAGFKAFDREAFETLRPDVEDDHWFWDTEMLVRAQRKGFRVREFPVRWTPKGDSKVDLVRDVFGMGSQIVRVFWEFSIQPRANNRTGLLAGFALIAVAVALMTTYLEPAAVYDAMTGADYRYVALAAAVFALSWPIRGSRYRSILDTLGFTESTSFLTGAVFISQLGNLVFPARMGDGIRAYVVKARRNVPYTSGFAGLAIERIFDLLSLTILAGTILTGFAVFAPEQLTALSTTLLGTAGDTGGSRKSAQVAVAVAAAVGLAAIVAVIGIVASARSDANRIRPIVEWASDDSYVEYVASVFERFFGDLQTTTKDPAILAWLVVTSALVWLIDAFTAVIVFEAFDVGLPFVTVVVVGFFAVSIGNLSKVLPLSPGGIGLYEGAVVVFLVALTPISPEVALAIALVDHFTKHLVTLTGGVTSLLWLNVSLTEAVESAGDIDAEADRPSAPVED